MTSPVETCLLCDVELIPVLERDPDGSGIVEVKRCPMACHLPPNEREEFRKMAEKVVLGET